MIYGWIPEIRSVWDIFDWLKALAIVLGSLAFVALAITLGASAIRGYARVIEDVKTITSSRGRFIVFMIVVCGIFLFIWIQIRKFVDF